LRPLAIALLATALAQPVTAADLPVDLELVLAIDVSGSVDAFEARQQRDGYLAALADPAVVFAIQSNQHGRIAIAYMEWAGFDFQQTVVDWRLIDGKDTAAEFIEELAVQPIGRGRWTSISGAIDYAVKMFPDNGYIGTRQVIDISGDGPNNSGRPIEDARAEALAMGITINGLPILNDRPQPFNMPTPLELRLDEYYIERVIGGPGAFIVVAEGFEDFRTAILTKLIREIAENEDDGWRILAMR
jgi:hypothetical protein